VPAGLRSLHDPLAALNARFQTDVARIAPSAARPDDLQRLEEAFRDMALQAKALESPA
jgi:hypothetical protein